MAERKHRFRAMLAIGLALLTLAMTFGLLAGSRAVAESGPIRPLDQAGQPLTDQQQQAQRLALASAPVQRYAQGQRVEVFAILPFRDPFAPAYAACGDGSCFQIDSFDFEQEATITAIVHVDGNQVLDAWLTPGAHPLIPSHLYQRAVEIIQNDPDVVAALGYVPTAEQTRLMDGNSEGTRCLGSRLCAGAAFMTDSGAVWVLVDLHEERIERLWWADKPYDMRSNQIDLRPEVAPEDCGVTIHVTRNGWNLDYRTTPTDGLELTNLTHDMNGVPQPVATRLKLVQWHARYPGNWGFRDYTGCGGSGGGFHINPYGNTQIRDLYDQANQVIGFAVVQDFRMGSWAISDCNYRYEQHFEFYADGRFRVKTSAYGRGCGDNQLGEATYRPVMRLDLAVAGDNNDTFSIWNGSQWVDQAVEGWWLQSGPYTVDNYRYRVMDQSGFGYYIEPGRGQFDDLGTGDNAYTYLTLHRASEGDGDLGLLPGSSCCNTDHQQGPHTWVNGEAVLNQNIVLWYVPASDTITTWAVNNGYAERPYCWTESASLNWPCFTGPMFVPTSLDVCSPFDFDCNFVVDSMDVTAVASRWGCVEGDPSDCYDAQFDLDADQDIDIIDILGAASRWGCSLGQACYRP